MISKLAVGAALASAADSAGSSTLACRRGAAGLGPATSGRSRHAPASTRRATRTERLMRPLLGGGMERAAGGARLMPINRQRTRAPRVADTQHRGGERAGASIDQWNVTPSPKATTFCLQPVANLPPPPHSPRP